MLTARWLRRRGKGYINADCGYMESFEREWPDGAEITAKNYQRARKLRLPIWFFLDRWATKREQVALRWPCNAGVHNLGDADCPHRYSRRGDWKVIKEILQMKGYEVPDE